MSSPQAEFRKAGALGSGFQEEGKERISFEDVGASEGKRYRIEERSECVARELGTDFETEI